MKKQFITLLTILLFFIGIKAQAPHLIPYSGVVRDASGNIMIEQEMEVEIIINESNGDIAYHERHEGVATDTNGILTLNIGGGTLIVSGSIQLVKWWEGEKYLNVKIKPLGQPNFIDLGTEQLKSVPYALGVTNPLILGNSVAIAQIGAEGGVLFNNPYIELRGLQPDSIVTTPYIDFSNDPSTDYDARIILKGSQNDPFLLIGGLENTKVLIDEDNEGKTPDQKLSVNGNASKIGGGDWAVFSDPRIKKDIQPLKLGLSTLKKIHPIWYRYDIDKAKGLNPDAAQKLYVGLNAAEIAAIPELRELMIEEKEKWGFDDLKMIVSSDALMYISINAIKEQQALIRQQQQLIKDLNYRVEVIETARSLTQSNNK